MLRLLGFHFKMKIWMKGGRLILFFFPWHTLKQEINRFLKIKC